MVPLSMQLTLTRVRMDWLARAPDLNPIEMRVKFQRHSAQPRALQEDMC